MDLVSIATTAILSSAVTTGIFSMLFKFWLDRWLKKAEIEWKFEADTQLEDYKTIRKRSLDIEQQLINDMRQLSVIVSKIADHTSALQFHAHVNTRASNSVIQQYMELQTACADLGQWWTAHNIQLIGTEMITLISQYHGIVLAFSVVVEAWVNGDVYQQVGVELTPSNHIIIDLYQTFSNTHNQLASSLAKAIS